MQDRALFVVNSVYQLITSVHIKLSLLKDKTADIIVTDIVPEFSEYLPRIKMTGVFDRVMSANVKQIDRKYLTGSVSEISEGFKNSPSILRMALSDELIGYNEVYFSNFDVFARMLACRYYFNDCEFICYEDGFSTYVIDYLRAERMPANRHPDASKIKDKVKKALLYEPGLAMRGDSIANFAIPKINRDDIRLRETLNYIFDYKPSENEADFIFLEQSFRAEGIKTNDLELIRECRDIAGASNFTVKPHPRNVQNVPMLLGLTGKYRDSTPWEIYLLNNQNSGKTVITVCSNAALTGKIVFGDDINTVMLYNLFSGKVLWQEDEVLRRYLNRFYAEFAGENYYVPKTVYELRCILRYLGGEI